jgi:dolichol-phosphate mannosyltransferase
VTEPNPSAEAPASRIVIVMPTYNERQNLDSIAGRVRATLPTADLLVVDDSSPDGTGDLADKLAEADPHVQVMHRTGKAGLGKAYIAGFGWALERGYDVIVEMDADGSHQPEHLPSLVAALDYADLSIGSRWVPGGRVVNWPKSREALSPGPTSIPGSCSASPSATPLRASAPTAPRRCGRSAWTRSNRPGTASRST